MPWVTHGNADLYYEDVGSGPAIITTHGVTESHLYWVLSGVADKLIKAGFRVISTDMRGHGYTRTLGPEPGYDVETVAADFGYLADRLGLDRFHILSHATGGMAAIRYAMDHSERLLSLMSTDTGSATFPTDWACDITNPRYVFERQQVPADQDMGAAIRGQPWTTVNAYFRATAAENPFLNSMHLAEHPHAAWAWFEACQRIGDVDEIASFYGAFFDDANPYLSRLQQIKCPCLALHGEHDVLFVKPMALMAREIPNCERVVLKGRGHMTALEDPRSTGDALSGFLGRI